MTDSQTVPITPSQPLLEVGQKARQASRQLALLSAAERDRAIVAIAQALKANQEAILAANQADCEVAQADGISPALYARLKLDAAKLNGAIAGVHQVSELPNPIGQIQIHRELDQGLVLKRVTCPLGVLGVIFEARPDAVMQISALALKSGNSVILKGGREALRSCEALVNTIHKGLKAVGVTPNVVQLLTTREETRALLSLDQYIDLIIPRGSNSFVRFVQDNTRIPVLGHADGLCHLYLDRHADLDQAIAITLDAKTQYPAACNAIETLLVHQDLAPKLWPRLLPALATAQVELRVDPQTERFLAGYEHYTQATEADWATEYTDLILAVKQVDSLEAAIAHITTYGSRHTEAIVTEDLAAAAEFLNEVDAAGVFHNCSTRFSDGFRYGFGAEVGISTQKMPPRGPVGLEGLVTYKYQLVGKGHIAATYSGSQAKPFNYRDL